MGTLLHLASDSRWPWIYYLDLILLACFGVVAALSLDHTAEEFSEELFLRPLPDGKVLSHFHFAHELPPSNHYGHHHRLFPKAIYQLVQKFRIQEMELSFTQGRWNYNRWGSVDALTRLHAKPSGVELWAVFAVPDDQIDATWGNLTHALSGLFCASLNFLDSPVMVANPVRAFVPDYNNQEGKFGEVVGHNCEEGNFSRKAGRVRYGALPREAVCTENLTPWLKLLPCRDKAGLATLLDRPTIYKGWYHSLRLYIRSNEFKEQTNGENKGTVLQQTLSLVIQPPASPSSPSNVGPRLQPSWSLSSLFGRHLPGQCLLATSSRVYMDFEGPLVQKLELSGIPLSWNKWRDTCMSDIKRDKIEPSDYPALENEADESSLLSRFQENNVFKVKGMPSNIFLKVGDNGETGHGVLLAFSIPKQVKNLASNVGLTWRVPFTWTPTRGPFRATRFLVGSGNARGSIAIVLKSNHLDFLKHVSNTGGFGASHNTTSVMVFQVVPWYIRLYFHTAKVLIDEQSKQLWEVVQWMQVLPSEDRKSPGVMEMELIIPSNASVITLIMEFDKGFLRIDEHPPDANRGFDLPSALLSFPRRHSEGLHFQLANLCGSNSAQDSALLQEFQIKKTVQVYTEVLLVPLATPDFSMPYNVITLTCTVLALYFGSLLNTLRRRIGEEERLANSAEGPPPSVIDRLLSRLIGNRGASTAKISKILKFVLVVVLGVAISYFTST